MRIAIASALFVVAAFSTAQAQENTLLDVRVGEWATYSTSSGSMQERHTVVARRRHVVVVRVDEIIHGRVITSRTETHLINDPDFLRGAEGQQQVTVGGRTYNCAVVHRGNRTFFYSNQVPVTGLVLVRRNGNPVKQVVDFGI